VFEFVLVARRRRHDEELLSLESVLREGSEGDWIVKLQSVYRLREGDCCVLPGGGKRRGKPSLIIPRRTMGVTNPR